MAIVLNGRRELICLSTALLGLAVATIAYREWLHVTNATTVALTFLMVVLLVAAYARLRTAIATSLAAMLFFNYFFLPPVGTLFIADLHNLIALFAFLTVSLVASNLSEVARARTHESLLRQADLREERKAAELSRKGDELKSALLASLAHDLRTPLTAIRVAATNLQSSDLGRDDRSDQGDVILSEVERLTRLFQNILEMARIDAGALPTEVRWVHPSEIIAAAREHVEQTIRKHSVDVSIHPDTPVELDPRPVATAIAHVLENAAQYAPVGSVIRIDVSVDSEALVVRVHDRGPGIARADRPRLFERFYRGEAAKGRSAGTGMGLSIAQGMLACVGGRIWAEDSSEAGAVFTISVPAGTREGGSTATHPRVSA
jgi:K+-sensing histidine kinase KdpD